MPAAARTYTNHTSRICSAAVSAISRPRPLSWLLPKAASGLKHESSLIRKRLTKPVFDPVLYSWRLRCVGRESIQAPEAAPRNWPRRLQFPACDTAESPIPAPSTEAAPIAQRAARTTASDAWLRPS
ncbi:uncharacterized protein TrAtP1_007438 [Trichoderma atroviride]|uniref:uncharacterized protein n=1 Tax=Hypocrea atroviridis TaxID=63577 RepID=UPI003327384F|nr:hypothetical protein TrAtP1_007438 [Trichoderma atroviride]